MYIKTKHYKINLATSGQITKDTKFIRVPRSTLMYRGAELYIPDPDTMTDDSFACIHSADLNDASIAIGHARKHPGDQPNRLVGYMVAIYQALKSLRENDPDEFAKLLEELNAVFASNKYLSRLAKFWDPKYIDDPAAVTERKQVSKKKETK